MLIRSRLAEATAATYVLHAGDIGCAEHVAACTALQQSRKHSSPACNLSSRSTETQRDPRRACRPLLTLHCTVNQAQGCVPTPDKQELKSACRPLSTLHFTVGQVQDIGLIFLNAMTKDIAHRLDGEPVEKIMGTAIICSCVTTILLGLTLVGVGKCGPRFGPGFFLFGVCRLYVLSLSRLVAAPRSSCSASRSSVASTAPRYLACLWGVLILVL